MLAFHHGEMVVEFDLEEGNDLWILLLFVSSRRVRHEASLGARALR